MADDASRAPAARRKVVLLGAAFGLAYGLLVHGLIRRWAGLDALKDLLGVMTLGFLALVPLAMGWLTVRPLPSPRLAARLFLPWIPVSACLLVSMAVGWEGAICLLMAAPIMLVMGSIGGLLGGARAFHARSAGPALIVLPLLAMPLESQFDPPAQTRAVIVERDIDAPVSVVWRNVVQVPEIRPEEQRPALFTALGFPRALSATLHREEVGGIRHARFEGGVLFIETITAFEPERRLDFTLEAREDLIPPDTLDSHVTIGGPFFDTLDGSYVLTSLPGDRSHVRLTSHHRLSTRFNPYAGLWSDAIMRSIQANIMDVVVARCESAPARGERR